MVEKDVELLPMQIDAVQGSLTIGEQINRKTGGTHFPLTCRNPQRTLIAEDQFSCFDLRIS
jgi:hypothetical protein